MLEAIILVAFPILVAFGGVSDLLTMKIPNRVSLLLASSFVFLAIVMNMPMEELGMHLAAGAIVLIVCFAMFAFGWMGGGDAKMASVIGLWFGLSTDLAAFTLVTAVYGMLLTLGLLSFRNVVPVLPKPLQQSWLMRIHHAKSGIPYGIAIAAAALQIYGQSAWLTLAAKV